MRYYPENPRYYPENPDRTEEFPAPVAELKPLNKFNRADITLHGSRCTTEPRLINLETGKEIPPRLYPV